jgi:hypothetical protein
MSISKQQSPRPVRRPALGHPLLVAASAALALGALALGYVRSKRDVARPVARVQESAAATDSRDDDVAELRRRVASLEATPRQTSSSLGAATKPALKRVSSAPPSAQRRPTPSAQDMDDALRLDPRDASWARQYEQDTRTLVARQFPGDTVTELTCASSLCRMRVEHPNAAAQHAFEARFWSALPAGYSSAHMEPVAASGAEPAGSVVYVLRKDHDAELANVGL